MNPSCCRQGRSNRAVSVHKPAAQRGSSGRFLYPGSKSWLECQTHYELPSSDKFDSLMFPSEGLERQPTIYRSLEAAKSYRWCVSERYNVPNRKATTCREYDEYCYLALRVQKVEVEFPGYVQLPRPKPKKRGSPMNHVRGSAGACSAMCRVGRMVQASCNLQGVITDARALPGRRDNFGNNLKPAFAERGNQCRRLYRFNLLPRGTIPDTSKKGGIREPKPECNLTVGDNNPATWC